MNTETESSPLKALSTKLLTSEKWPELGLHDKWIAKTG